MAESVLDFGKIKNRDKVAQNIAITNLEARVRDLEKGVNYNTHCINYLTEEVTQLKLNYTKAELDKAERVLKLLGIDSIYNGSDRHTAKLKIGDWIQDKLGSSIHRYKCVSIVPVIPAGSAKFYPYAILRFLDVSDARHFESILHKHKITDPSMSNVRTVRWTISSNDLSAGNGKDFIQAIQDQIAKYYNTHITNKLSDTSKVLQNYHAKMIRVTPSKVSVKGETHVVLEFIDPCDNTAQMYFKPGSDPFEKHDFSRDIPNPITRNKAETDSKYKHCTLQDSGLWAREKPKWM